MFYPENSHFEREKRLIFLDGSIEGHISDLDEATNDLTSDFLDDRKSAMEEIREKKEELVKNIDTLTPDQKKRASEILERGKQTLESVAEQEEHKTDIEDLGTILNEIQQVDSTDDW